MARGKKTCRILKEIRKQIADANGIEYAVSECKFRGNCLGTCPKCESEVRYLEEQLEHRRLLGKAVVLAGISMNVIAANAAPAVPPIDIHQSDAIEVVDSANIVTGYVVDETGEPIIGASIKIKGKKHKRKHDIDGMSNVDGDFSLAVDEFPQTLIFSYIGYEDAEIKVTNENHTGLKAVLKETELSDDVIAGFIVPSAKAKTKKSKKSKSEDK